MKLKLAIAASALALVILPSAALADSQKWKVESEVAGVTFTLDCTLDVANGKLSGPCISSLDPSKPVTVTGTYTDTTSEFSYDTDYQGTTYHVVCKGTMQPDHTSKGTLDANGNEGTFTMHQ